MRLIDIFQRRLLVFHVFERRISLRFSGMIAQSESLFNVILKALESNEHNWKIIKTVLPRCGLYDFIRNQAADGAESGGLDARQIEVLASLKSCNVPDNLVDVVVPHFIENTIGPDQDVVKDLCPVWLKNNFRFICNASRDSP